MLSGSNKYKLTLFVFLLASIYWNSSCLCYCKGLSQKDVNYQDVIFKSGPFYLAGHVLMSVKHPSHNAIIISHGSNILGSDHILYKNMARRFAKKGYIVFTFDYRGYNKSPDPKEIKCANDLNFTLNFTMDLINAVTYVKNHFTDIKQIILVGHSFGGGVTVSGGIKDRRVSNIVSISPGRRAEELFFGPNAPRGPKWIQRRMTRDMKLKKPVPLKLIWAINKPVIVEYYEKHIFKKPILFIDGELEPIKDRKFLKDFFKKIKALKKDYISIPKADHYFGTSGLTKIIDSSIIQQLVDEIDAWIRIAP